MHPLEDPGIDRLAVLHVIAPSAFGGAESVVSALASGFVDRGHSAHVAAILDPGAAEPPFLKQLRSAGVDVTVVRSKRRRYLMERRALIELIGDLNPDVVHTHGYRADVTAGLAARASRVPVVSTAHGEIPGGMKDRLYLWLQRRVYRRFDCVVAVSGPLGTSLTTSLRGRTTVHTVPNAWEPRGVPLGRVEARANLGLPDEAFVVGWVGRLTWEKGADVLIEAASKLQDLDLSLCFVGDGPERAALAQRARDRRLDAHWPGAVPEAWRLFSAFDLLVLSSRTEGTPMVLLEAMYADVPIIATAVGGVPDVVKEGVGCLVPPDDPRALATAIRRACSDVCGPKGRTDESGRARSPAPDLEAWLREHERLYAGLARDRAPAASERVSRLDDLG